MSVNSIPIVASAAFTPDYITEDTYQAIVYVGDTSSYVKSLPKNSTFSFLVFDRTAPLKGPVFTVGTTDVSTVPEGLAQYATPQYILVVATQDAYLFGVPQGDLYEFLIKNGASSGLKQWEALAGTEYQCGSPLGVAYCLMTIPGTEASGIEMMKLQSRSINYTADANVEVYQERAFVLVANLAPMDVNGVTQYVLEEI